MELTKLIQSIKRLIDLVYVFAFFWGIAQFIAWMSQFA